MRRALISDIHGNYEALQAVFADIEKRGIEEVYFLGDLVGYGPDAPACIDLVSRECKVHLLGNHDHALLSAAVGFNRVAKQAIDCQRDQMRPDGEDADKQRRWDYLSSLEERFQDGKFLHVHASPHDPIYEYVLETDAMFNHEKLKVVFDRMECIAFVGHTHVPGVMIEEPRWYGAEELHYEWEFKPGKQIINLGSVGQPRDRDPRACYVEVDGEICRWHRVEYDIDAVIEKVKAVDCLDDRNGLRLLQGR